MTGRCPAGPHVIRTESEAAVTPGEGAGPLPVGQEQSLLALARTMRRGALLATAAVGVPAVAVAGVLGGPPGAVSALVGVLLGLLASLFTLWLMRRTARKEPRIVMIASMGGLLQKSIFLLIALFAAGAVPGVDRTALSVGLLLTLIATAGAEGWAGYRLRTAAVEPPAEPGTSGSTTGLSDSPAGATAAPAGGAPVAPERPDRGA